MFLFNFIAVVYSWVYLPSFSAFLHFAFKKEESRGKAKKKKYFSQKYIFLSFKLILKKLDKWSRVFVF